MYFTLSELLPATIARSEHSETIRTVSPDFVSIFGEAEVQRSMG
jgi:hypothetical protein